MLPEYESDEENEEEFLQELFAAGKLKPGLNVPKKEFVNDVNKLNEALNQIKNDLPWIERMDLVNDLAELAPELAVEMNEQENIGNEFKRETLFHRQAQLAAIEGIARLKSQGIQTIRPDDYFAEMMKSDEHMQKVRRSLLERQAGLERSEKVKQIRQYKKMAKKKQVENTLRKQKEKRDLNEEVKKYRKGLRTDLDFLETNKSKKVITKNDGKPGKAQNKNDRKKQKFKKNFKKGGKKASRPGKERRKNLKNKKR